MNSIHIKKINIISVRHNKKSLKNAFKHNIRQKLLKEIRTEIEINSSPEKSWQVLIDFAKYPEWNPIIRRIKGALEVGTRLEIYIKTAKGKTRVYRPFVTKVEPNHELRWTGKSFLPGLFNGERIFNLEAIETNRVRFSHAEVFTGFGVFFAGNMIDKDIRESFESMNKTFKMRVERDN